MSSDAANCQCFAMSYYHPNNYPNLQTGQLAYLMGVGPLPPATPQQQAIAQMQASLDSGMFDQIARPHSQDNAAIDPVLLALSNKAPAGPIASNRAAVPNITVEVRVYGATEKDKKSPAITTQIIVPADIPPDDFFSRMHAQMNIDPKTAILGWKEAAERRGDPYHRLSSPKPPGRIPTAR
ncbi:hypothetical protein K438DRAFT_1808532 [Mycena galopus ATCC 62051]|nr:hypothetical protein K438DRAFT_1808532 [Mycena galopus ATCC 62051]